MLQVMQEAWGYDQAVVWAAGGLGGGIARMGSICGNVSGSVAAYGLRVGSDAGEFAKDTDSRQKVERLVRGFFQSFRERFGHVDCRELIQHDISTSEGYKAFRESGMIEQCNKTGVFAVRHLIENAD